MEEVEVKLITKAIEKAAPPLYANEHKEPEDVRVVAKFFNPCGRSTFYMTEYDPVERLGYGFVRGEMDETCDELGYFSIAELESIRLPFGLTIERDIHFGPHTLARVMEAPHA